MLNCCQRRDAGAGPLFGRARGKFYVKAFHSRRQRRNYHGGNQLAGLKRSFITADLKITECKLTHTTSAPEVDTGIQRSQYGGRIGLIIAMGEIAAEGRHIADTDVGDHMAGFGEGRVVPFHDFRSFNLVDGRQGADAQTEDRVEADRRGICDLLQVNQRLRQQQALLDNRQ